MTKIDISNFEEDHSFYDELDLLITIKSFNLQAIRKRYLESRKNKSGKAGSVERREVSTGGIARVKINGAKLEEEEVLAKTKEPRGIDVHDNKLAIATEDIIYVKDGDEHYVLKNPWFSYIHTVKFSPHHPERVLIASSGLDMLMEMNYKNEEVTFEWLAWEHGWNKANDPRSSEAILLTRSEVQANKWSRRGIRHRLIDDPQGQVLPTAMRAAFINSVAYEPEDQNIIYATFFHDGAVYKINKESGNAQKVLGELKNPHGGCPLNDHFFATSTSTGELVLKTNNGEIIRYDFSSLEGKPEELEGTEWLQNSLAINKDCFLTIDSNRNHFVILNIAKKKRAMIPYDENWAVQDLIVHTLSREEKEWISRLQD